MNELTIEPSGSKDFGPCECWGGQSRTVWGHAHGPAGTVAAYFVQWTLGQVDRHGAHFDLIIGKWGTGANRSDRFSVSLEVLGGSACLPPDATNGTDVQSVRAQDDSQCPDFSNACRVLMAERRRIDAIAMRTRSIVSTTKVQFGSAGTVTAGA